MLKQLPKPYAETQDWTWDDLRPYAEELLAQELNEETADEWLSDYSRLARTLSEIYSALSIEQSRDTANEIIDAKYQNMIENFLPKMLQLQNDVQAKIIQAEIEPPRYEVVLRNMVADLEIFREENLPLISQDQKLGSDYDKVMGAQTFEWKGEEITITKSKGMLPELSREEREQLWRAASSRQLQDRERINQIWQELLPVRVQMAKNAGFSDYRAYMWKARKRFDYTPQDCETFHRAIEEVVVPATTRLYDKHRQNFGYDSLRPWDMVIDYPHQFAADSLGREPLRPYQNVDELNEKMSAIFHQVDPVLGGYYDTMREKNLLDLENRKGKAPGGYCSGYAVQHVPFIFMNAVGLHDDVQTLLHEGGHAFHYFETKVQPYFDLQDYPIEFAEVASMSMELLAAPYFTSSGLYNEQDAARARIDHLESMLFFWPYMAVMDAFQHWAYLNTKQAADPANCDAAWGDLWSRFIPAVDYSGLEDVKVTGWHRKLHIYRVPFYYVEYGLAQLGATQVFGQSLKDQAKAVADYRKGLSLGYSETLPNLFAAAGAKFAFDSEILSYAVDLIENTINQLEPLTH